MKIIRMNVYEIKGTATREGYQNQDYAKLVMAGDAGEAVSIWEWGIKKDLDYSFGEASTIILLGEAILGDYSG